MYITLDAVLGLPTFLPQARAVFPERKSAPLCHAYASRTGFRRTHPSKRLGPTSRQGLARRLAIYDDTSCDYTKQDTGANSLGYIVGPVVGVHG
jgi:hypothetical protein